MSHPYRRPFRFAAGQFAAPSPHAWADAARRIEALGYDVMVMPDHFGDQFAPALALLAAAQATTTLRVGCTVFANDFRHPAILAHEAATLDVLTDGRFEFGIGAGWVKDEYDAAGIPFAAPGVRVARMIEALSIIKRLWTGEEVRHAGAHYTITGLTAPIQPVQQPHPPIFIGGGGQRLLSCAAREADSVGLISKARPEGGLEFGGDETEAALARKVGWVRAAARDRFELLELAMLLWKVTVSDHRQASADRVASTYGVTREQVLASPYYPIGSVDSIVEQLLRLREQFGVSHFTVFPEDLEDFAPVVARLRGH
jgi:probable F420-dependent oxidoreductase